MKNNRYALYGAGILAGGAVALWVGFPPVFLLLLLVCPLMMFFMMRGMHGGGHGGHGSSDMNGQPPTKVPDAASKGHLDGSHERIDRP